MKINDNKQSFKARYFTSLEHLKDVNAANDKLVVDLAVCQSQKANQDSSSTITEEKPSAFMSGTGY